MSNASDLTTIDLSDLNQITGGAQPQKSAEQIGIEREAQRRKNENPVVRTLQNCAAGAAQGYATSRGNPAGAVAGCIVNTVMPPKPAY